MEPKRLLECLDADAARLREVAKGVDPSTGVPSCPDWSVADLVQHVGLVYLHKVECMRLGDHPASWPPEDAMREEPLVLFDRAYAALKEEFADRAPGAPAFTWYAPDQSVAFWIRRMAQETVIHRVDAELAAATGHAPIPDDLALDGIDELLVAFIEYGSTSWPDVFAETLATADGRGVRIEAADAAWLVRATPESVQVRMSDVDDAAAVVRGEPTPVLLWLWNRGGEQGVSMAGDADLIARLRRILTVGTG